MADHGQLINERTYWTSTDPKTGKQVVSDTAPTGGSTGIAGTGILGSPAPAGTQYHEATYEDGTKVLSHFDAGSGAWKQDEVKVDPQIAAQHSRATADAGKIVTGPDGRKYRVTGDTMVPLEGQGAGVDPNAPKPGTEASLISAQAKQQQVGQTGDYQEGLLLARSRQLDAQQRIQEGEQKLRALDAMLKLQQISPAEYKQRWEEWKSGVDAGQAERRLTIEQQNANTTAGQLGVSRGTLGVNQQNADTNREQVIQSAASNAVDQTIRLLGQYTKVGPGFGAQFAAGVNMLSGGGGKMNITPDAFMVTPPSLDDIRHQAVSEAIDRLKGGTGMAPATAAAVNATSVPGAPPPAPLPPPPVAPPNPVSMPQVMGAAQAAGIIPGAPPAPPPVVPPYTGPVGQGGPGAPPNY